MELGKLDTSKAPGPDNINNKTLKNAKYELSDIIMHLFNSSLKNSFIPTQWTEATNFKNNLPSNSNRLQANSPSIGTLQGPRKNYNARNHQVDKGNLGHQKAIHGYQKNLKQYNVLLYKANIHHSRK